MRDVSRKILESGRPEVPALDCIENALGQLFADTLHSIAEEVVAGLSYEELIGTLLHARDLAAAALEEEIGE